MTIKTDRGALRYLVGRKIVKVKMNGFKTGRFDGDTSTDPLIVLDDGSRLMFITAETETGDYGVDILRSKQRGAE